MSFLFKCFEMLANVLLKLKSIIKYFGLKKNDFVLMKNDVLT